MLSPSCSPEPSQSRSVVYSPLDRPAILEIPTTYRSNRPATLFILLHGYGGDSNQIGAYTKFRQLAHQRGALLIAPQGLRDSAGQRFWNGSKACCDFDGQNPDDVGYLASLIELIDEEWNIDPDQRFVIGFDAGAFLAHSFACSHKDKLSTLISLGGSSPFEFSNCVDSELQVLEIHGEKDLVIDYMGTISHPGALGTVARWSAELGCQGVRVERDEHFDWVVDEDQNDLAEKAETSVSEFIGCPENAAVTLWTMAETGHQPQLSMRFAREVIDWSLRDKRNE